ncbi:MAG: 50S ribosomal protein L23 [Bradymonadaceae bacterium]
MNNADDIILEPLVTEKSLYKLEVENTATFKVKFEATKPQIRQAVQELFDVDVDKVNTLIMPSQPQRVGMYLGRTQAYKKAYVSLSDEDYIDFFAMEGEGQEQGVV